jgi:CHAT domain-containing protein
LLEAGATDDTAVQLVDLGSARRIDQLVATLRTHIATARAGSRDAGIEDEQRSADDDAAAGISAAVLKPLLLRVGRRRRLVVAPDGNLARLPFEILPLDDDRRLIDAYEVSYLSAGRDVLAFGHLPVTRAGPPLIMAAPNYDLELPRTEPAAPADSIPRLDEERQSRDLRGDRYIFTPLDGTEAEGRTVASLLGVSPVMDDDALEGRLKGEHSPLLLHLATHGFFLPDPPSPDAAAPSERPRISEIPRALGGEAESPLLRSGLALAGANTRLRGGQLPPGAEDGILNAQDVTALDLRSTELVVLSACETGLGDVLIGEGVFGLRRSFILAGARTVVMSLWKVPDDETRRLMERFYEFLIAGDGRAAALRKAALSMKKEYPNKILAWGAFICVGEGGPFPGDCLEKRSSDGCPT